MFVAKLSLDPQPQRRSIRHRQRAIVECPGEDRLRMEGIDQTDALIISRPAEIVIAMEDDVARGARQAGKLQDRAEHRTGPLPDRAPPLDAIVAGDLGAL